MNVNKQLLFLFIKVNWNKRKDNSAPGQSCFVSLDGVDFPINEPTPFSSKWYSHKFKAAGLRYEVGLCMRTGEIVWAYGSFPCGDWPDLRLARHCFVTFLESGEKVLADKGYNDRSFFILPNEENKIEHKFIMSRHETVNKRIRQFNILNNKFRHPLPFHKPCFHAIVNLTQLTIKHEPLFTIN